MSEFNSLRICKQCSPLWSSAVLLNCTKARIEPLFELNRTAASVASSDNGMPTFSTPSTQKRNSCRMLEGEKNNLQAHTRKKNFVMNQGVEKNISRPDQITPPPPHSEVKWSAPYQANHHHHHHHLYLETR